MTDESDALQDIKAASATALRDLRGTLKLLRDEDDTAPRTPIAGLEDLPRLVEQARATGLDARVEALADDTHVPTAIAGAAFRIVQEALTNVMRHADASSAHVRVHSDDRTLKLEVTDDGRATTPPSTSGFGLRGMRERATALGGRVTAGPHPEGGWRVHATLPLDEPQPR